MSCASLFHHPSLKLQCSLENQQLPLIVGSIWLRLGALFLANQLYILREDDSSRWHIPSLRGFGIFKMRVFFLFFLQFLKGTLLFLMCSQKCSWWWLLPFLDLIMGLSIQSRDHPHGKINKTKHVFQAFHLSVIFVLS